MENNTAVDHYAKMKFQLGSTVYKNGQAFMLTGWSTNGKSGDDVTYSYQITGNGHMTFAEESQLSDVPPSETNEPATGLGINITQAAMAAMPAVFEPAASAAAAEPAATEPAATEPAAAEPAATEPAAAEPAASEPAVSEPAVSEPAASEPAATEPAATEPAAAEPAAAEPAASEPAATEPAATGE